MSCTPAMASGLTDHIWSIFELLSYKVGSRHFFLPFSPLSGKKYMHEMEKRHHDVSIIWKARAGPSFVQDKPLLSAFWVVQGLN